MPATFEELDDSPTGEWEYGLFKGMRKFLVEWNSINEFVIDALGSPTGFNGTGVVDPARFPGFPTVVAKKAKLKPASSRIDTNSSAVLSDQLGPPPVVANTNKYSHVIFEIEYGSLPIGGAQPNKPNVPSGTFLEIDWDVGGEFLQVPGRSFVWDPTDPNIPATDIPQDVTPGVFIGRTELLMTWYYVNRPPVTAIRQLRGRVNSTAFIGVPLDRVLFNGARYRETYDINGDFRTNLVFSFSEVSKHSTNSSDNPPPNATIFGHNHVWSPEAGGQDEHWFRTDPLIYQRGDLNLLFQYEP